MANFLIVVDADKGRRTAFVQAAQSRIDFIGGLVPGVCVSGDMACIWAANARSPISAVQDEAGAGIVWGDAVLVTQDMGAAATPMVTGAALRDLWSLQRLGRPAFNGYYAALLWDNRDRTLTMGVDLLGLFPLYYFAEGEVLLIASSPELFRYHPLFRPRLDPQGLMGVLLINNLVNGRSLWQGVRRLEPGHLLCRAPNGNVFEVLQYKMPQDGCFEGVSFEDQLESLDAALAQAVETQTSAAGDYGLLLSGGLDSRTLGGYMKRCGVSFSAVTMGNPQDIEMQCAARVARTLGVAHCPMPIHMKKFPEYARYLTEWEHLANGGNLVFNWGLSEAVGSLSARRIVAGYVLDRALGDVPDFGLDLTSLPFDVYFDKMANRWGIVPADLKKLVQRDVVGDAIDMIMASLKAKYESYGATGFRRILGFELQHRHRYHIGAAAWQLSFGAWPVFPVLDQEVLRLAAGLPLASIEHRRAQKELLCRKFPSLAALPLDRNDFDIRPLFPKKGTWLAEAEYFFKMKCWAWQRKVGLEPRYYYRIFDINNAGWQSVRALAEEGRDTVTAVFHPDVLEEYLPHSGRPLCFEGDRIIAASKIKALMAFLRWSRGRM